jgi:predicted negative regulator of RcsB-dependent stress response
VKSNKRWLAALVLLGVLTYWGWEWQQSPAGLLEEPAADAMFQGGGYKSDH